MMLIDLLPYIGLLLFTLLIPKFTNEKTYLILLFLVYFVFSGFRYGVGWDYFNYVAIIQTGGWAIDRLEPLVRILALFCERNGLVQFFFVATSFFIYFLFFLMFSKESTNPAVSLFVLLCVPSFFLNSMVMVRFFMAVSAVFLSAYFGYNKQYIPYFGLLVVAFLCHKVALFAVFTIPLVLFQKEFSLITNLIVFITCFVVGTIIGSFSYVSSFFSFLSDSSLFGDVFESGVQYMENKGTVNFSKTPLVFALINFINLFSFQKNNQIKTNNRLGHYITMYNIGCSLMFLFSFNTIFANRLSVFFSIFLTLIIPFYRNKKISKIALYSIFVFMFFYELTINATHPLFIGRRNCWLPYMMNFSF